MRAAWTGASAWGAAVAATFLALPGMAMGDDAASQAPPKSQPAARRSLSEFTTGYIHDEAHRARAFNVELAAEALDGKIIAPGATLSFNDTVGERTAAFGFEKSVVLRDRMIAEGTGGGTCQVASTLHAAALLAGLDVVARSPHSRPSAYIRMGLDATVAFPSIDLKLKNPRADRVVIHARAARGTLLVSLDADGPERPVVTVTSEIVEWTPFARTVERDRALAASTVRVKAFGIPGFRVRRTREVRATNGEMRREVVVDVYPPTPAIVQVAPSFDASRLMEKSGRPSGSDAGDEPMDSEAEEAAAAPGAPAIVRDDAGVVRPSRSQLRPSTRVVLDNSR